MRITLIRHAESETNASDRAAGSLHVGLSPKGERQADLLGRRTPAFDADHFLVSDLARARLTAERGFDPSIQFQQRPLWRERHFGVIQGMRWAEASAQYPELFGADGDAFYAKPPEGEAWSDVHQRVVEALDDIMSSSSEDTLIVSHGGPIRLVACALLGLDPATHMWRFLVDNTSVSSFDLVDGTPILTAWNDISHLGAERSRPGSSV